MSKKQPSKIKICFVGLYAYSLFNTETDYKFGGAEAQSSLWSKGLARNKQFDVSYIVNNHGQPRREIFANVTVIPHSKIDYPNWYKQIQNELRSNKRRSIQQRLKLLLYRTYSVITKTLPERLIYPQLRIYDQTISYNHFRRYIEVDADVYITETVSNLTAEIAAFCKRYNKKFVLLLGSDQDVDKSYRADSNEINIYGSLNKLCNYAIMQADAIVAQTNYQAQLLEEDFGRSSTVITNPIDLQDRVDDIPYSHREVALWIGRSDKNKQPEVLIQLAQLFPHIQFVMIMNRFDDMRSQLIIESAPDNVTIHEFIPFHKIDSFFAQAFVFINTSGFEGFPNTFLEAGKYRVPILSYVVDPDDFIQTNKCGIVARGNFDVLADALNTIQKDKQLANKYSENVYQYVETHHNLQRKVAELTNVIRDCLDNDEKQSAN